MNVLEALKKKREIKANAAQKIERSKQINNVNAIPRIALIVANALVLSLDYRVVEAVYKITDNVMLAVFALFTSGAMFVLWFDVLYQYLLASEWQKNISLAFSGVALVSAGVFAFLDYGLSANGANELMQTEKNILFAGMVILTIANGAGLFWWYIIDAQVTRKSLAAKQQADNDFDAQNLAIANDLLEKVEGMLTRRAALESKFGAKAVDEVMMSLMGLEEVLGVDINGDGKIGNKPQMRSFAADVKTAQTEDKNPPTGGRSEQ